tara:strand:+ start:1139 stop:1582 length:444 start_codon:yes stop_codon:yes gene_type:complete
MKKHFFPEQEDEPISENEEDNIEINIDDYMNHPKTREIITNQHYFDFEENIGEQLKTIYRKHAYIMSDEIYLNDNEMLNDDIFMNFIYQHITKDYDNDFIKDNSLLENTFYNNLDFIKQEHKAKDIKKTTKIKTNNKIFDWATKSYK